MKHEFIQPRFVGARFDEATLPVEVARDLAAYEVLVVELAKHLYRRGNEGRQRVPRGFDADFHLHIERVDGGSARPMLAVVSAAALMAGGIGGGYFVQARDLVSECIAAPDGQLPEAFPRELLGHFNQVGRSLHPGERMELPRAGAAPAAVLTPDRRKRLVLEADTVYEREIELTGTIAEADWEKSTFRLRQPDGAPVTVPMPKSFHELARRFGGRERHQAVVRGIGQFDSWDKLQRVKSVDGIDVQPKIYLATRLEAMSLMADGWYDGKGSAPDKDKLAAIAGTLIGAYPEHLPLPLIAPTPEGNLLLEWNLPGDPSIDLDLQSMSAAFHALSAGGDEVEQTFVLDHPEKWQHLFVFLSKQLPGQPA
jgi:hypothetical protein